MSALTSRAFCIFAASAVVTFNVAAQERDRSKIADKYKWNLADIYPTDAAWRAAKDKVAAEIPKLSQFRGKLTSSPAVLADALDLQYALDKELSRLYVYASMLADQDTRDSPHQGMQQEMVQLAVAVRRAGVVHRARDPQGGQGDDRTVHRHRAAPEDLYASTCDDIARRAAHTLSDAEEKLLADAGPLAGAPSNVFNILSNADFPYPTVTLERRPDGQGRSGGLHGDLRALPNRADREKVMAAFFNALGVLQPHLRHDDERRSAEGGVLRQGAEVSVGARGARSTARTFRRRVYTRLIDGVNRNLPAFHRYLKLRKRMMGVDSCTTTISTRRSSRRWT